MPDQLPRVVVIGSGIGGSALTMLLAHAGLPVTLLEKNAHLGGVCAGYDKQGFRIDFGAHLFTEDPTGHSGNCWTGSATREQWNFAVPETLSRHTWAPGPGRRKSNAFEYRRSVGGFLLSLNKRPQRCAWVLPTSTKPRGYWHEW